MEQSNSLYLRNRTIEIYRGIATLLVVAYHVWVYCEYPNTGYNILVGYGGEIGVTLFFIISGFSIYCNIFNKYKDKFSYIDFIKKRFVKLAIGYYICMFILIIFNTGNSYLLQSSSGIKNIAVHILFLHNLFPSTHGSINGVFWTLGVIMQFYLIAPILYKIIKKIPYSCLILSIGITVLYKYIIFNTLCLEQDGIHYFIYGRQLLGSLDNFVCGMFIANWWINRVRGTNLCTKRKVINIVLIVFSIIMGYYILHLLDHNILYSNTKFAYIWHTCLAIVLMLQMIYIMALNIEWKGIISSIILFISNMEYGIYLWHLPIIISISDFYLLNLVSPLKKFYFLTLVTLLISIISNKICTIDISNYIKKLLKKDTINKTKVYKFLMGVVLIIMIINTPNYTEYVKDIIHSSIDYFNGNIHRKDNLSEIVSNVADNIDINNNSTYVYFDNNDYEGTMNFWAIRYYLSPMKAIHWNTYAYNLNMDSEYEVYSYINLIDVDYIIVRNCPAILDVFNLEYSDRGYIFRKVKGDCLNLKMILSRI